MGLWSNRRDRASYNVPAERSSQHLSVYSGDCGVAIRQRIARADVSDFESGISGWSRSRPALRTSPLALTVARKGLIGPAVVIETPMTRRIPPAAKDYSAHDEIPRRRSRLRKSRALEAVNSHGGCATTERREFAVLSSALSSLNSSGVATKRALKLCSKRIGVLQLRCPSRYESVPE